MPGVTLSVLGRVAVRLAGVEQPVRGRRERAVLAVLLAARREVVSVDRLVAEVWGDEAPETARGSLQVAVSRLRTLLEPDRRRGDVPTLLVSAGNGYALVTPPGTVDSETFTELVERAHHELAEGRPEAALRSCEQAAALWTGSPYGEVVAGDTVSQDAARLEDLRLCLTELKAEALLATGAAALVPGPLESLLAEHPFRERAWHLLGLALYRSGRQADALDALRRARSLLVEELGVDPSPALQQLELDVLAQSPSLGAPAPAPAPAGFLPVPSPPTPDDPGMVGRDALVAAARQRVTALTRHGRGGTVVVSGEAGIGKTRLATLAADLAASQGARVLWGRCHEADVSPAYWPWVPVVRELAGADPGPEIAALLTSDPVGGALDAESAALRTYDAVARLILVAAEERPVALVLEDLHWADTASLQLLAFAAEAFRDRPVLLVATVRIPEVAPDSLGVCLAALARLSATRIHLAGLDAAAVGTLVTGLTGRTVEDGLADVVAQRTDGNPFFVIELVRLLEAEQRLHPDAARDIAVPHGVQDVLRLRLARLDEDVRSLLAVAAVGGREVQLDRLSEVAGLAVETVIDLLDAALRANVVEEGDLAGRYRFTHALVRETLADSLSRTRRGRLHAAYGRVLERRLEQEPDLVAEAAHHLVLGAALAPELAASGVRLSVNAARLAEGRGALDRARVHWEQARTADELAAEPDPDRRFDVLLGLGRARYRQGDVAGSREALDAAVALAAGLGDVERVAEAATSFRGAGVWHWREFGTTDPSLTEVLRDCLARIPQGGPLQARVLASLAVELMYAWRSAEAEGYGRRAVDVARAVGDPDLFADVAFLHELMLFGRPGAPPTRLALVEELLALPLNLEQELYTRFGAAAAFMQVGQAHQADLQMTRAKELARRLRHTGADVPMAWWFFYRAVAAEDPAAAALLDQARAMHARSSVVAVDDMGPMAELRLAGEGTPASEALVRRGQGHPNPAFRAFVAHVVAEAGDPERALGLLGDPVPDGAWDYASMYGDCLRVDVLAAAGRTDLLPEALERIAPWQHEFASYGSTDCAGSVAYFVGRAHEALGDAGAARTAYVRAVEANREAGMLPWLRRAERRLGTLR